MLRRRRRPPCARCGGRRRLHDIGRRSGSGDEAKQTSAGLRTDKKLIPTPIRSDHFPVSLVGRISEAPYAAPQHCVMSESAKGYPPRQDRQRQIRSKQTAIGISRLTWPGTAAGPLCDRPRKPAQTWLQMRLWVERNRHTNLKMPWLSVMTAAAHPHGLTPSRVPSTPSQNAKSSSYARSFRPRIASRKRSLFSWSCLLAGKDRRRDECR